MKSGIYGALWASRFIRFHNREEVLSTMVNIDRIVATENEYWAGLELKVDCGGSKESKCYLIEDKMEASWVWNTLKRTCSTARDR